MEYLTYTEYRNLYGSLDPAAFCRHAFRAQKKIDAATFGRLKTEQSVSEAVKRCVMELVELAEKTRFTGEQKIAAVSNDGVSVTYANAPTEDETAAKEQAIIYEYLTGEKDSKGVPLLYMGV
ncbi:MAG: hypothetical protein LBQ40_04495 [Clostridiales bacterium]|jgi:hypothetical protein|nr:hypothetical protein [Clostridiales bacterium]